MIWLVGIAVVLLAILAVIGIQLNTHLYEVRCAVDRLSSIRHLAEGQRDLAQTALETLGHIERHTATIAAPEYDRQYEADHYPWGRPKGE